MAGDYKYDVFISYRRLGLTPQWLVETFLDPFTKRLEDELARPPTIFWDDEGVESGEQFTPKILAALRASRCLVVVLSKPYFMSQWCLAEWKTFQKRAQQANADLAVPVRLHDSEDFSKRFKTSDFTQFRQTGPAFVKSDSYPEYEKSLDKLAARVASRVENAPEYLEDWPVVQPFQETVNTQEVWSHILKKTE